MPLIKTSPNGSGHSKPPMHILDQHAMMQVAPLSSTICSVTTSLDVSDDERAKHNLASFYGSSRADNGEGALNTPETLPQICETFIQIYYW
eukprot:8238351-Pyramimonas_sp.AAC.1